ncbi:MAG: hypothetical protein LUG59_09550, partial [Enterocloster clostridioformis]|nr:hypothetical protein [Enterocloster clostridioformis]
YRGLVVIFLSTILFDAYDKNTIYLSLKPSNSSAANAPITPSPPFPEAICNTITIPVDPTVPATILKTHPDWQLFIDDASASRLFAN